MARFLKRMKMQVHLIIFIFFSIYPNYSSGLLESYKSCMSKTLTYTDVDHHFAYSSSLYFLFGINIHRPFTNEYDQTHTDASIFIVVTCVVNSSDCIAPGGSLPPKYRLQFAVGGVPYSDRHPKMNGRWHRTKLTNYELLYESFHSHSWYDQPQNGRKSIWNNFIMNLNFDSTESLYSKWMEFDIKINDAGIQFIEGEQLYNNVVVQEFTLYFFVPTRECLQPPLMFFDDLIFGSTYLSALHFRFMTDKCHLYQYTCQSSLTEKQISDSGEMTESNRYDNTIHIVANHPSLFTQRISHEQGRKPTTFIDHISDQMMLERNASISSNEEYYSKATCSNTNPVTSREFLLCAQNYVKNDTFTAGYRIEIILCKYSQEQTNYCDYHIYRNIENESSRLFIPINGDSIIFIGFLRMANNAQPFDWMYQLEEDFNRIYSNQLSDVFDHTIELRTDVRSENSITRSFRILTDQISRCHIVCRSNCVQESPIQPDYYLSASESELLFYCVICDQIGMMEELNDETITFYTFLSPDVTLFRIRITDNFQQETFRCFDGIGEFGVINANFYLINQTFSCSIKPMKVYPYHQEIDLECDNFTNRADIIIWAITKLDNREVRILLNPLYVTNENWNPKIRMKIYGIPHGGNVTLEIASSFSTQVERYELTTIEIDDRLIIKMNTALEWNYFSSALRLMEKYLNIYEYEFYLFKDEHNPRFELVGLNENTFLLSVVNYYRLILNYMDEKLLHIKAADFSQKIYSIISVHLSKYQTFYPSSDNVYLQPYLSLLIQLSSHPKIVTYETYHLFRHIIRFILGSLSHISVESLEKVFELCVNLRTYVNDPTSMPIPTITDTNSLYKFNQIVSQMLTFFQYRFSATIYDNNQLERIDNGSLDFIRMKGPFVTKRWTLRFIKPWSHLETDDMNRDVLKSSRTDSRYYTDVLSFLYYPQEYIPLYHTTSKIISVDYLLGQLLSITDNNDTLWTYPSYVSFSLQQIYLNTSVILQTYFSNILLIRMGKNHYSHRFSFQMNTKELARNISLVFLDLPHSPKYLFTIDIAYNDSCLQSKRIYDKNARYSIHANLWQNHFVYSIPIKSMSIVCAHVEIVLKDTFIRNTKQPGKFLVIETGCYTFNKSIYEDYYRELQDDKCQLINENNDLSFLNLLSGAYLTCYCHIPVKTYFLLCQPRPILVEYELNAQTWLHFYIYLSLLLLSFLLVGLYAIYRDTVDDYKPLVHFVADNQIPAVNSHLYQLTIFTGLQQATSKNPKIYIRLIGEKCHDASHCLNLKLSDVFQRGSVDQFLLTSFVDIGQIVALNMWYDDIDTKADFYIRHCILYDYYRHRTYYFCCYTWLSSQKGLNVINEIFYVAQEVDQYAFGHLFLSTYSWLYYHYHLLNSVLNKQKINTLPRIYRLHIYFCLLMVQLCCIQFIIVSCQKMTRHQRCVYIFPAFLFLVDQSFAASGWVEIYQIIRLNLLSSLYVALSLSISTAFFSPLLIHFLTWITNRLELYRQRSNSVPHYQNFDTLHSIVYTIASSLTDLNSYCQDIEQFRFIHKFDLQHRLSFSTIGEGEQQKLSQSDSQLEQNNSSFNHRQYKSLENLNTNSQMSENQQLPINKTRSRKFPSNSAVSPNEKISSSDQTLPTDEVSLSSTNSQSSIPLPNVSSPTINLKINWPKTPAQPSFRVYLFYSVIYYGLALILGGISITCMYVTMKTFTEIENYFLTSTIIFIHMLTIIFTLIVEFIFIILISLLNATLLHMTDEEKFISPVVQIPIVSTNHIEEQQLNHTFTLNRDMTLTDVQLRERIRERFVESSLIRAVRDMIGYILFMVIITLVFAETSRDVESRLTMRQYTLQLLLREDIFQNIDHIPDTMNWINYFIENRLFLEHKDYNCRKDACNYVPIPDSPLYLSKSIRIRQVRVERKDCHERIKKLFYPLLPPNCSVGGKNLMNDKFYVIDGQRKCSGWHKSLANESCTDVCNHISIWSAIAYKKITKLYTTYESPWYFMLHLLPEETIERCNRKRKYYDLIKYNWLDEKTLVVIIEGNLYSPQTSSMISFVLIIEKKQLGIIAKEIFIEVSDYTLTTIEDGTEVQNDPEEQTETVDISDHQVAITHYLFAVLLFVIFTTKLLDVAKFTRNFGVYGLVFFLRTLSNIIDGILLILCCYYFLLFYFDYKVLQLNNLIQSLNIQHLFISFRVLIINNSILNHLIGLICLFAIFKFLYLLKFNPKTYLLAETIYRSAEGFGIILFFAFMNYFIFALIGRLLFQTEENFRTIAVAFRVVLVSSIKDAASTDRIIPITIARALWQFLLWLFSAKVIEYFLISFVVQKFSDIRKNHRLTDEERIVGRIFQTFWTYFAFNKKQS